MRGMFCKEAVFTEKWKVMRWWKKRSRLVMPIVKIININKGLLPCRERADLFIVSGQSNTGRSLISEMSTGENATFTAPLKRSFILNPYNSTSAFSPLQAGINTTIGNTGEFGPEVSFAWLNEGHSQCNTYIVKYGVGNTSLASDWLTNLSRELHGITANAFTILHNQGVVPSLRGIVWMQGENDATRAGWARAYASNLSTFFDSFDQFLRKLNKREFYQKTIGRISSHADKSAVYRNMVRAAQEAYCNDHLNNARMINCDSYPLRDSVHYSASGQLRFGQDIFRAFRSVKY